MNAPSNPLTKYFEDHPDVTTEVMAKATGIPYNTISNLRIGRKISPNVNEALKIAKATQGEIPVSAWEN